MCIYIYIYIYIHISLSLYIYIYIYICIYTRPPAGPEMEPPEEEPPGCKGLAHYINIVIYIYILTFNNNDNYRFLNNHYIYVITSNSSYIFI